MAQYLTEQKKMLVDILKKDKDRELSIEELIAELNEIYGEDAPGKSTVYRLVTRMVEEGRIRRLCVGRGRRFVYQLIESERCHSHMHLKCVDCGKLIHLEHSFSEELGAMLKEKEFFVMEETVLLGKCALCGSGVEKI